MSKAEDGAIQVATQFVKTITTDKHISLASVLGAFPIGAIVGVAYIFKDAPERAHIAYALVGAILFYTFCLLFVQRQSRKGIDDTFATNIAQELTKLSDIIIRSSAQLSYHKALERRYKPHEFRQLWSIIVAASSKSIRSINGISPQILTKDNALEETFKIFSAHNIQMAPLGGKVTMERIFVLKNRNDIDSHLEVFRAHLNYCIPFHIVLADKSGDLLKQHLSWPLTETFMICDETLTAIFNLDGNGGIVDIQPRTDRGIWSEYDKRFKAIKDGAIQYHTIPHELPELKDIFRESLCKI